jgi:hypothetical protein
VQTDDGEYVVLRTIECGAGAIAITRGQGLRERVEARKHELEVALAKLGPNERARADIENALNEVSGLLTGELDQIPRVVAAELSTWLEANKHVNEWHSS